MCDGCAELQSAVMRWTGLSTIQSGGWNSEVVRDSHGELYYAGVEPALALGQRCVRRDEMSLRETRSNASEILIREVL